MFLLTTSNHEALTLTGLLKWLRSSDGRFACVCKPRADASDEKRMCFESARLVLGNGD